MPRTHSRREALAVGATTLGLATAGCSAPASGPPDDESTDSPTDTPPSDERIDDWQFDPTNISGGPGRGTGTAAPTVAQSASAGFATGGAKDVASFRENVEEGYLPIPSSLSYEGLFYDYYFDTGTASACSSLFCPTYSTAVSADPFSRETEHYLRVGLNAGVDLSDVQRKALDLVIVLDISGSMESAFDEYYYDRFGNRHEVEENSERTKIEVAADALASLTTHLRSDDRLGVVLFNDEAYRAKPLRRVGETDMDAIRGHLQELEAGGGTRLSGGVEMALEDLSEYASADPTKRETRAIVMTDAMPNLGETSEGGLLAEFEAAAENGIYATFLGIGVDFNTELVDAITAIEGANYYAVHSAAQFEERLDDEFVYMVTPLVFDLQVELDAPGYDIEQVYGSSAAEEATGELMYVNTLFPSPSKEDRARGGIVLVKLAREGEGSPLTLRASWETRTGESREADRTIEFTDVGPEHFGGSAIRKGVLLARYADLLKNWMIDERRETRTSTPEPTATDGGGIAVPPEEEFGQWERQSTELTVSEHYRQRFSTFADYFEGEMSAIGDDALQQELDLLRHLATYEG